MPRLSCITVRLMEQPPWRCWHFNEGTDNLAERGGEVGGARTLTLSRNHSGRLPRPSMRIRILVNGAMSSISMMKVSFCSRSNLGAGSRSMEEAGQSQSQVWGKERCCGIYSTQLSSSNSLTPRPLHPMDWVQWVWLVEMAPSQELPVLVSNLILTVTLSSCSPFWRWVSSPVVWGA